MAVHAARGQHIGAVDGRTLRLVHGDGVAVVDMRVLRRVDPDASAAVDPHREGLRRRRLDRAVLDPEVAVVEQEDDPVTGRKVALGARRLELCPLYPSACP